MNRYGIVLFLTTVASTAFADHYPRQRGIDAVHYVFQIEMGEASNEIVGEAKIELRFKEAGLTSFRLDLASPAGRKGMTVSSVESKAKPLEFLQKDDELIVTLTEAPAVEEHREFVVRYRGVPGGGLSVCLNRYNDKMVFAENWPDKARQWLPLIDHPSDKAASEFIVVAPATYRVVSNGLLVEETDRNDGKRSTHWRQSVPIPSWQYVIAAGPFEVVRGESPQGLPVETWSYPQDKERGRLFDEAARQALAFFSNRIGPYPFEKLGTVEAVSNFGGMENAGTIFYSEKMFNGSDVAALVSHEVAHQWFGASVTESDWNDVWLSEGFATYASLLFIENQRGRGEFLKGLQRSREAVLRAERAEPNTPVVHADLTDMNQVIGTNAYQKGAWTLHMLRCLIGDDAFFAGLRSFYQTRRDGNASTEDFRQTMELASHQDLKAFFEQWLDRPDIPLLRSSWSYDPNSKRILLDLSQTAAGKPYRLPIEIGFGSRSGKLQMVKVDLVESRQRFEIDADRQPERIVLDPEVRLLHRLDSKSP